MTYDAVYLSDEEWGNETMEQVAREWFAEHPRCLFLFVHEHAGWGLGFIRPERSDAPMRLWASANDTAVLKPGPRPERFSGHYERRDWRRVLRPPLTASG